MKVRLSLLLVLSQFSIANCYEITIPEEILNGLINAYLGQNSFKDFGKICELNFKRLGVRAKCEDQLNFLCQNQSVAITMLDATSKFPYTGILYSSRLDLGNYDECLSIDYTYDENERILGKYCPFGLLLPDVSNISDVSLYYKLTVCIPNKCTAKDFINIAKYFYEDFPEIFLDKYCITKESGTEYTLSNIIVIFLFLIWIFVMFLSTLYDAYLHINKSQCKYSLLLAFSILTNGKKLLKTSTISKEHIQIFDGLKVIAMMWVVAGHGITMWSTFSGADFSVFPVSNELTVQDYHYQRYSAYLDMAHFNVDTFFFISGFLVAYHYLKIKRKSLGQHVRIVPYLYLHRILRLLPSVGMLYVFGMWIFPKLGSGPFWEPGINIFKVQCEDYWWSYFLFLQNYVNYDNICLIHTWYLAVDMQLYFLSPFVLIPLVLTLEKRKGFLKVVIGLIFLCILCVVIPITHKLVYTDYINNFDTHSRMINYFLGFLMAVILREKKDVPFLSFVTKKKRSMTNFLIWTFVLTEMFISSFLYQDAEVYQGHTSRVIYFVLSRTTWCLGLCWIVYSCYYEHGGIVNWILTRPIYQVLARLTYSIYLTHFLVIGHYILQNRDRKFFSDYVEYYLWCGYYVTSLVCSVLWTLAFESPILVIEKAIFRVKEKPQKEEGIQHANYNDNIDYLKSNSELDRNNGYISHTRSNVT